MKALHFKGIHIVSSLMLMILTFSTARAITIFPFVFYKDNIARSSALISGEESIHIMQQLECGLVGLFIFLSVWILYGFKFFILPVLFLFYILYGIMYLVNLIRYQNTWIAYCKIPFENEAYRNANRSAYLGLRKPFAWIKYIRVQKTL